MNELKDWSTPEQLPAELDKLSGDLISFLHEAARCQKTLETLLAVTDDFIYIKDINHKFLYASDAFAQLTNHLTWRELVGKDDFDIFPADHASVYYTHERPVLEEGKSLTQHEEPYYDKQGNLRWVTSTKNPVFDENNNVIGLIGISKDITDLKNQREQINYLASHDDLTGLHNRRAFFEVGTLLLNNAARDQKQVSLIYMDLDKFKEINDSQGHTYGDQVLKAFAKHICRWGRESDLVARLGGDEFVLLMTSEQSGPEPALNLVERLQQPAEGLEAQACECSIGISYTCSHYNLQKLLHEADIAMYQAKKTRQDTPCIAEGADA